MSQKTKYLCRFTRELDEKLIELVSENEVLYDTKHKYYKDLNVRDDVWLAISSLVGKTVADCKTRWRSLRDLYHRKKKEQKMGKRLRSPWEYMDSMKFLENFTTEKKKRQKEPSDDEEEEDAETIQDSKIDIKLEFDPDAPSTSAISNNGTNIEEPAVPPPKKIKLEEHPFCDNATILHLLRDIRDMTRTREDPIMAFFDSMAKTVVKFPPAQAAEVKLKVCQVVTEMECRILEDSGNYPDNLEHFD